MIRTFTMKLGLTFALVICAIAAWAQTSISGNIIDSNTKDPLLGASVVVKGTVAGTISNLSGDFSLNVTSDPPLTLAISMVGYTTIELEITESNIQGLEINLEESAILGQEVVVSASRVEESILQSPTSVEKMDILMVQNTSADDYYKALGNLKGVDMNTSSINFQIVNTRGFGSNGNTRFVQLTDGMDTQAPALNFPIGNLNGPNVLDVESMELIPGASSAIYGANAFNGVLLVNSKNPFDYQGVSAYYKAGVNHVGSDADQDAAPMHEVAVRYAKAINNKLAFKISTSYMQADDWYGTSDFDRNANLNPFPDAEDFSNISADRLHFMGDEANLNMNILRFSTTSEDGLGWQTLATARRYGGTETAWRYAQNGFLPNHVIAAPAYPEQYVVDYNAKNAKVNAGVFYRITDKMELSYLLNYGFGTSVYTGAQRYSLQNFSIGQHRLQLRGDNFFVRAYTTRERSGDSYIAEFLAKRINDERHDGDVANYLTDYPMEYLQSLFDQGISSSTDPSAVTLEQQLIAHRYARRIMDERYPLTAGTEEFNTIKNEVLDGVVPIGPKFDDESNLYHYEGQYAFNQIDFVDVQVGATFRQYELNSNGTIFDDGGGGLTINEYGGYGQVSKKVAGDRVNIITSIRYDKNENFDGQISPKLASVWTIGETHNIRASIQRGFRNPTTQGQYIDLDIISARLMGGLSQFAEKYELTTDAYPVAVVDEFTERIFATGTDPGDDENVAILTGNEFTNHDPVQPEKVTAVEVGYKSLIANKLLVDAVFYHNTYTDFITQIQIRKFSRYDDPDAGNFGQPNYNTLLRGSALNITDEGVLEGNTGQIYTNIDRTVTAQGAAIGLTYSLPANYTIGGNYNWNVLNEEDKLAREGFISEFNTPEHKFNLSFANRKLTDNLGFNITYRWQDEFLWQSSFARGQVEAFSTLDAQVSYRLPDIKSVIKAGGSNLFGDTYNTSLGSPNIGTIYYVSITFDQFMN